MVNPEEKLNMSLDQLIAKSRAKDKKPEKRDGRGGRGEGGFRRGRGGGVVKSVSGRDKTRVRVAVPVQTKIRKPVASRKPARVLEVPRMDPAQRRAALDGDAKWSHDLYREGGAGARPRPAGRAVAVESSAKLIISNLDYKVSDEDVKELFQQLGPLKSFGVKYDRSGRSEGQAFVVYEQRADALKAQKKYNNVALDGRPMKIDFAGPSPDGNVRVLSSGISVGTSKADNGAPQTLRSGVALTRGFKQATQDSLVRTAPRGGGRGRMRSQLGNDRLAADDDDYMME